MQPRLMDKLESQKSGLSMQDQLNKSSTIIGAIPLEKIAQIKEKVRARQRAIVKPADEDLKTDGVGHLYACTYVSSAYIQHVQFIQ